MGFPPFGDNADSSPQSSSRLAYDSRNPLLWFYPRSELYYVAWMFSSRVPGSQFRWWDFPHLEAIVNLTLLMGFPPLRGKKFAGTADGPTQSRKRCKLTRSLPGQTNHTVDRDQHSEEAWLYRFQTMF